MQIRKPLSWFNVSKILATLRVHRITSLMRGAVTTSLRFCDNCTGCPCDNERVQFKVAVLVFQCLSGNAPTYLLDDCQLIADISMCRLRSTDTAMCAVRRSQNTHGDWCFAINGWTTPVELM